MGLRRMWRDMNKGYIIRGESQQDLRFPNMPGLVDRMLPGSVEMGKYKLVFTKCVSGGYMADVYAEGRFLGELKVSRVERGIANEWDKKELRAKLELFNRHILCLTEVEYED